MYPMIQIVLYKGIARVCLELHIVTLVSPSRKGPPVASLHYSIIQEKNQLHSFDTGCHFMCNDF